MLQSIVRSLFPIPGTAMAVSNRQDLNGRREIPIYNCQRKAPQGKLARTVKCDVAKRGGAWLIISKTLSTSAANFKAARGLLSKYQLNAVSYSGAASG